MIIYILIQSHLSMEDWLFACLKRYVALVTERLTLGPCCGFVDFLPNLAHRRLLPVWLFNLYTTSQSLVLSAVHANVYKQHTI